VIQIVAGNYTLTGKRKTYTDGGKFYILVPVWNKCRRIVGSNLGIRCGVVDHTISARDCAVGTSRVRHVHGSIAFGDC